MAEDTRWTTLKTVLQTDLTYWKDSEAQAFLSKDDGQAVKMALSVISSSIGLIEYYIDIVEKIESGELDANGTSQEP